MRRADRAAPSTVRCPRCGGELLLERIPDLAVASTGPDAKAVPGKDGCESSGAEAATDSALSSGL